MPATRSGNEGVFRTISRRARSRAHEGDRRVHACEYAASAASIAYDNERITATATTAEMDERPSGQAQAAHLRPPGREGSGIDGDEPLLVAVTVDEALGTLRTARTAAGMGSGEPDVFARKAAERAKRLGVYVEPPASGLDPAAIYGYRRAQTVAHRNR